jgi:hypothetical protein
MSCVAQSTLFLPGNGPNQEAFRVIIRQALVNHCPFPAGPLLISNSTSLLPLNVIHEHSSHPSQLLSVAAVPRVPLVLPPTGRSSPDAPSPRAFPPGPAHPGSLPVAHRHHLRPFRRRPGALGRVGFFPVVGDRCYSLELYLQSRLMLELLLRSLPQAVFQTALYLLGSSRATRIYIDQPIFVRSIGVSLLSVVFQYCSTLYESTAERQPFWRCFWRRVQLGAGPCLVAPADSKGDGFEDVETADDLLGKLDPVAAGP